MTDKQLIDAIREKANGMFGTTYSLLMQAADRLEQLTALPTSGVLEIPASQAPLAIGAVWSDDAPGPRVTIRELSRTEHEPLDRWEDR